MVHCVGESITSEGVNQFQVEFGGACGCGACVRATLTSSGVRQSHTGRGEIQRKKSRDSFCQ